MGMAERIERGQIDNFTDQQLRSYISNNRKSKHALAEYAMKVLMERIQLAGFTRRRLGKTVKSVLLHSFAQDSRRRLHMLSGTQVSGSQGLSAGAIVGIVMAGFILLLSVIKLYNVCNRQ